jgi:four helix bundle protein
MSEPVDLATRTRQFALRIIRLHAALPRSRVAQILGNQLLRSATSVGAHYREAKRAKSDADFINKVKGAQQELEESMYWLELIAEGGVLPADRLSALTDEANQLMAILVTLTKKAKGR